MSTLQHAKTKVRLTTPQVAVGPFILEPFSVDVDLEFLAPLSGGNLYFHADPVANGEEDDNRGLVFLGPDGAFVASLVTQTQNKKLVLDSDFISITPSGVLQLGGKGQPARINIQRDNLGENPGDTADSGVAFFSMSRRNAEGGVEFHEVGLRGVWNEGEKEVHVYDPVYQNGVFDPVLILRLTAEGVKLPGAP